MPSNISYPDIEIESPASEFRIRSSFERELREKICVRPPYFQLTDLEPFGADGVRAYVFFESPHGAESDALASAEVGRHLAILGSCALARNNPRPGRHYYLATEAVLFRHRTANLSAYEPLCVRATPDGATRAEIELFASDGTLNSTLSCKYHVLPERLFERLFKNHRLTEPCPDHLLPSPYRTPIAPQLLAVDGTSASCLLAEVTPGMCLGHFDEFPAMPVAVLMDGLHRLICQHAVGRVHPYVQLRSADVHAERLAFAGESVEFSIKLVERNKQFIRYQGQATRHGEREMVFGTIDSVYELLPEGM
jgi:hypothetical protein